MNKPTVSEQELCLDLRRRSKRGEHLSPDESAFVRRMFESYPEWYRSTDRRIFVETAPFGSIQWTESQPEDGDEQV